MRQILLICVLVSVCNQPAAARGHPDQDVKRALDHFIMAFNNLDWENFRAAFADDVTVFNPDIPEAPSIDRLDGRRAVEEGFQAVFAASRRGTSGPPYLHIVPRNVAVQFAGDAAIVTFEFDREASSVGRRTIIFRYQSGRWKIVHIHASNTARR